MELLAWPEADEQNGITRGVTTQNALCICQLIRYVHCPMYYVVSAVLLNSRQFFSCDEANDGLHVRMIQSPHEWPQC